MTADTTKLKTPIDFDESSTLPPITYNLLFGLAGASLIIHLITVYITPYSIHRDEFLYLAMGKYLQFWRMDFPPLIAILANISRWLFGDTLLAVRIVPAIAGAALVFMAALIARELGGKKLAQGLAAVAVMLSPLFLRAAALFQPVVLDQLWWTIGLFFVLKLIRTGKNRWWIAIGVICGIGLLTKFSILLFGFGLFIGFLISSHRRMLLSRWPYLVVLIAAVIGSPSLVGQIRLGFPVVGQMINLQEVQLVHVTYWAFLSGQVMMFGPALLLAIWGIIYFLFNKVGKPFRVIGWICLLLFMTLIMLKGKFYYIGPIYPMLFAAGAVAITGIAQKTRYVILPSLLGLVLIYDILVLPLGLPILPPELMARYSNRLGITQAITTNTGTTLPLPQDYADMLGWEDQVTAVARAYAMLTPEKQAEAVIIASNYGEAGALDFLGTRYKLPRVLCFWGSYWFFGPGDKPGNIVISFGFTKAQLSNYFDSITEISIIDNPWGVPEERNNPLIIAEKPKLTLQELWPRFGNQ